MSAKKRMFFHQTDESIPPRMPRRYDTDFKPDTTYRESLPDMTETVGAIEGSDVAIPQVGIAGFRLPLKFATANGDALTLEANVSGTVSLEAGQKGINMSRIIRTFYAYRDEAAFTPLTLRRILSAYRDEVGGFTARLKVMFSYPMLLPSLRSEMEGYQYYRVVFESALEKSGRVREYVEFDFVYSSACPCSAELSEHAREFRGAYSIPHSQRSKARIRVELADSDAGLGELTIEDLHTHCLNALQTETQVMVKREDEQAFAELNGAYLKFVEDAARLLHRELNADPRICDFQVACAHLESLHSHDAVSVISKGIPGGMTADFMDFGALVC